jgi:hypothetical protein
VQKCEHDHPIAKSYYPTPTLGNKTTALVVCLSRVNICVVVDRMDLWRENGTTTGVIYRSKWNKDSGTDQMNGRWTMV